ncbi:hypothetical protein CR513_47806, partial [Mucuna pruriens]
MDRSMIDAASGGALMEKTPIAARHLISNMASNTQQFRIIGASPSQVSISIDNLRLENQLIELTSLVRQLVVGSSIDPLYELDPEIELTLRSSDNNNSTTNSSDSVEYSSTNIFAEPR